jgi:hypothetical protein
MSQTVCSPVIRMRSSGGPSVWLTLLFAARMGWRGAVSMRLVTVPSGLRNEVDVTGAVPGPKHGCIGLLLTCC